MENNTQQLVDLYKKLGSATGPDGNPILSVTQVQQTTTTTYLNERIFDPATGVEKSPLLIAMDIPALDTSTQEVQSDLDAIAAIQALVDQVTASPTTPVQIKVAQPIQKVIS